jgi:hypothetical protein
VTQHARYFAASCFSNFFANYHGVFYSINIAYQFRLPAAGSSALLRRKTQTEERDGGRCA